MLLSMTGFGESRYRDERIHVAVEIRTLNNRYIKLTTKLPDVYASFEGEIEKIIREFIIRGTVMLSIRVERLAGAETQHLNEAVLQNLWEQLQRVSAKCDAASVGHLSDLLPLPGVLRETAEGEVDLAADWVILENCLRSALDQLHAFRVKEGRSMSEQLVLHNQSIAVQLARVTKLAPRVAADYRDRILERVQVLLRETDATVTPNDLIREVSIFADRADINEELVRLQCHLEQYESFLHEETSTGRKLEFLSQEMFREVNTIGSKANNVEIAHCVVDMKAAVEKIREIVQNLE